MRRMFEYCHTGTLYLRSRRTSLLSVICSFIPVIFGSVLIVAAILKYVQLLSGRNEEAIWFAAGLIDVELVLGTALVAGIYPRQASFTGLLLFSIFLVASFISGISGKRSCGCFGDVDFRPWYVFFFDLIGIAAFGYLIQQQGRAQYCVSGIQNRQGISGVRGVIAAPLISFAAACVLFYGPLCWSGYQAMPLRLDAVPRSIDLGVLHGGERREMEFIVRNPHNRSILLKELVISCICLESVDRFPLLLEPGQELRLHFVLDLEKERDFAGMLGINVEGRGALDEALLQATVNLIVR